MLEPTQQTSRAALKVLVARDASRPEPPDPAKHKVDQTGVWTRFSDRPPRTLQGSTGKISLASLLATAPS